MLWFQTCIVAILIKAAISITSFCSKYDGASSRTRVRVTERERLSFPYCPKPWNVNHFSTSFPLSASLFVSLCLSRCLFPPFLNLLCLGNILFHCPLLPLSIVREKNFFFNSLGRTPFFLTLCNLFSDFSSLYSVLLCSEAISRF